ncbi:hypothetical protein ACPF8X_42435, partial [Streptomyces sp. G35A]
MPRLPEGWLPDGTPAHGTPRARGGHPEQREAGGGWGTLNGRTVNGAGHGVPAGAGLPLPRQRQAPPGEPRQDYLDAFGEDEDLFAPRTPVPAHRTDPYAAVTDWNSAPAIGIPSGPDDGAPPTGG